MDIFRPKSIFGDVTFRELNGFRVRKRRLISDSEIGSRQIIALAVEHDDDPTPPLAVSFSKTGQSSNIFAVSDEDGHVSVFDCGRKFSSSASNHENTEKARIGDWVAHENAVFDICWIKEDHYLLTASGDQTVKLWNVQEKKCTGVLIGHTGSVKSLCSHPTNSDLLISGSRDGSFALWDLRCKASSSRGIISTISTTMVNGAHISPQSKRNKRAKAASMSITSVLYLKDEVSVATAGAADSTVKFWDVRKLKTPITFATPHAEPINTKERRLHGITSLSQDSSGMFLTATCMDSRVHLYNVLQLDKGPRQSFSGCRIDSFFVKSVISPDAAYILSGSSDGKAYIWQVNKPQADPVILKGHDGEVTAVDWCPSETGKVATASDDFTVRMWNIESSYFLNKKSLPSGTHRIKATPTKECRKLMMPEERVNLTKDCEMAPSFDKVTLQDGSPISNTMPIIRTPASQKKKVFASSDFEESFERTPEAELESPHSVLNPPSSVKRRTIRDYFVITP